MDKKLINEQVNNAYSKLLKNVSYSEMLRETKEVKVIEDFDKINNKMFFTCQSIKKEVEKHFPKKSKEVLEDLAAHIIAGLK